MQVPTGENLMFGDDNFTNFEEMGIKEARKAAFVVVAGGLGERLGYSGIKVIYLPYIIIFKPWQHFVSLLPSPPGSVQDI